MGTVTCVYHITPDSIEGFDKVKEGVENLNPEKVEEEPLAFGMKMVKATFIVPEEEGKLDELEDNLRSLEGVGSVEIGRTTRNL